jgi:hypothetical protein
LPKGNLNYGERLEDIGIAYRRKDIQSKNEYRQGFVDHGKQFPYKLEGKLPEGFYQYYIMNMMSRRLIKGENPPEYMDSFNLMAVGNYGKKLQREYRAELKKAEEALLNNEEDKIEDEEPVEPPVKKPV